MAEWLATAMIAAVILLLCVFAAVRYVKKLSKGCCGTAADEVKRIKAEGSDFTHHYTAEVKGMSCGKCALRVQNAFNKQGGISAEVSLREGLARIASEKPLPELIIRKTIADLGYCPGKVSEE